MPDEPNSAVAVLEPPAGEGAGASPESTPAKEASTPATPADWKTAAETASDDELMELLEKRQGIKDRLGQAHADRVLLKDRERIAQEVKAQAERDAQETAWQNKWQNMSRQEKAEFLLQNQEMQEQHARTIAGWWTTQSKSVKEAIPELKDKAIEEWEGYFQKYPESWGQTMAALIEEVVKDRVAKELESKVPSQAKIMAEALAKERLGKTLANGEGPDLRSSGPAPGPDNFVRAYARGESDDHVQGIKWLQETLKGA